MAVTGSVISVGTSATAVASAALNGSDDRYCVAQNLSSVDVFLGGSNVTTSVYGFKLSAGLSLQFPLARGETLYGCVATGTANVGSLKFSGSK